MNILGHGWVLALTKHFATQLIEFIPHDLPEGMGSEVTCKRGQVRETDFWRSHNSDILMPFVSTGPWSGQFSRQVS